MGILTQYDHNCNATLNRNNTPNYEMGILTPYDHNCNAILSKSKIPDYTRDYRNEYLFIRGINKTCGEFVKKLGREEIFKSPQADSFIAMFVTRLKFP